MSRLSIMTWTRDIPSLYQTRTHSDGASGDHQKSILIFVSTNQPGLGFDFLRFFSSGQHQQSPSEAFKELPSNPPKSYLKDLCTHTRRLLLQAAFYQPVLVSFFTNQQQRSASRLSTKQSLAELAFE